MTTAPERKGVALSAADLINMARLLFYFGAFIGVSALMQCNMGKERAPPAPTLRRCRRNSSAELLAVPVCRKSNACWRTQKPTLGPNSACLIEVLPRLLGPEISLSTAQVGRAPLESTSYGFLLKALCACCTAAKIPAISAVGVGGHPGTVTSTGNTDATGPTVA